MEKVHFAEVLKDEELVLKRSVHDPVFAKVLFKCVDENREHLETYLPWVPKMKSYLDEMEYLKKSLERWDNCEAFFYSMFLPHTQELIGSIGFHNIDWDNERIEVGYWLAKKYEGKGYISRGLKLIEQEAFSKGFHRIEILCDERNEKSASVPRRNGYTQEGRLMGHMKLYDTFRNSLIFSKRNEAHLS